MSRFVHILIAGQLVALLIAAFELATANPETALLTLKGLTVGNLIAFVLVILYELIVNPVLRLEASARALMVCFSLSNAAKQNGLPIPQSIDNRLSSWSLQLQRRAKQFIDTPPDTPSRLFPALALFFMGSTLIGVSSPSVIAFVVMASAGAALIYVHQRGL